jgi:hypothetical protein
VTDVQQIAARQKCSARQVNLTISLAFLAPDLVTAAVEGRLPRGIGGATPRPSRGMGPTVRSPRIESALAWEAAWSSALGGRFPERRPASFVPKFSRRERNFGTRRRDAKNHRSSVWRPVETKIRLDEIARKWPQNRLSCVFARGRRFPKTGWWARQRCHLSTESTG